MAQDGYQVGVSWLHKNDSLSWANNLAYTSLEGDKTNPIFGDVNDADTITFASQVFFHNLFGLKHWQPNIAVLYGDHDSDIDFNDGAGWMITAGIGRTF